MHRPALLPIALAALIATGPAAAQQPAADSMRAAMSAEAPPPIAVPAGAALTAGSWRYRVLMSRDGQSIELARRTVTVAAAPGEPSAWLLLEQTDSHGRLMADSLFVERDGLRPIRRSAMMGPVHLSLRFGPDSIRGAMAAPGDESLPVSLPDVRGLVASGAMLDALFTLVPLDSGWAATAVQVVPGPAGVALVPVMLRVEGAESVGTLDGDHVAWRLSATAGDSQQWIWVDRTSGRLLRMESSAPQAPDVRYLTVLESSGPGH